jgi:hypothetical protein
MAEGRKAWLRWRKELGKRLRQKGKGLDKQAAQHCPLPLTFQFVYVYVQILEEL